MTKLKILTLLLVGFGLGFVANDARSLLHRTVMKSYQSLNQNVSLTSARQIQYDLRMESDVLRKMAEQHWLGLSATEAKTQLTELGLFDFEKGSEGFAAGPVFLRVQDGTVVEIQALCTRFKSDGCKDEGVN